MINNADNRPRSQADAPTQTANRDYKDGEYMWLYAYHVMRDIPFSDTPLDTFLQTASPGMLRSYETLFGKLKS